MSQFVNAPRCTVLTSYSVLVTYYRCGECTRHRCNASCSRNLFCGHPCHLPCHGQTSCPPCSKPCTVKCVHSNCPKLCCYPVSHALRHGKSSSRNLGLTPSTHPHLQCASCVEPCDWSCSHQGKCPLVCGAPCSRMPCNEVRPAFLCMLKLDSTTVP